jgi:hypothetical protein
MILLEVEQGSAAWRNARIGIPTASQFHRIITPAKAGYAKGADTYRNELLAEWLLGEPLEAGDRFQSNAMQRGTSTEQRARDFYELRREVDVLAGGFILADDRRAGCSPDGRIAGDERPVLGGVEMKCPTAPVHVGYLLDGIDHQYRCQLQGGLMITGADWWDFLSYNELMPTVLVRVERDDTFIAKLAAGIKRFNEELDEARGRLEAKGFKPGNPFAEAKYETLLEKLERSVREGKKRPALHEIAGLG